jgi:hypothetical protein
LGISRARVVATGRGWALRGCEIPVYCRLSLAFICDAPQSEKEHEQAL